MRIRLLLIASVLFFHFNSLAQQLPLDFSSSEDTFTVFGNSGFSFRLDLQDSNNQVGEFFNDGSQASQGFYIDLAQPITLNENNKVFTLSFYAFDSNSHTILLKLEDANNDDVEVRTTVTGISPSGWTTVTFNFTNAQNSFNGNFVNPAGSYSRLTLFIDEGVQTSGTYLIDNIFNVDDLPPTDYNEVYDVLVWSDEFDGANGPIDSSKWFHQTQLPNGGSWFNGEQQHYTNRFENSKVEDGFLVITAIKELFTDQNQTKQYTSARLNSKYAFTYGRVDVRAKLPFGDGTWPAIWTLGKNINESGAYWYNEGFGTTNWPLTGEIDIMEHGLGAVNHVSSALHTSCNGCFGATMNFQSYVLNDVANTFHIYSVNWSPEKIVFLIDAIPFYTYNPTIKDSSTWPFFEDQYLLLNIAMGGVAGAIDPNFVESSMVIDYVRVFQNSSLSTDVFSVNSFSVHPNPATDIINITGKSIINGIDLYSITGKLILSVTGNTKAIHTQNISKGMYLLNIETEHGSVTKKVFIN